MTNASPGASIMKLGILAFKQNPSCVVTLKRTFAHPVSGQIVTTLPIPTMARPSFWQSSYYGLHHKYDKVLYEDGWGPVLPGSVPQAAVLRRYLLPILPHTEEIPAEEMKRFLGANDRDIIESNMAYKSCEEGLSPPVDARARRGVELLMTMDPRERVVMPWNMHHHYYLAWKLRQCGYIEKNIEEIVIITQAEGLALSAIVITFTLVVPLWIITRIIRRLLGW